MSVLEDVISDFMEGENFTFVFALIMIIDAVIFQLCVYFISLIDTVFVQCHVLFLY